MLDKVISGGQTGAEQAGWRAARAFGVATGGWMSNGFATGDGPHPEFAELYGAGESPSDDEQARINCNVKDSDATLWFGETTTWGAQATVGACQRLGKPCLPVHPDASFEPDHITAWIVENQIQTLNVAGNREDAEPGIGDRVHLLLLQVLQQLGHEPALL